jgi:hypothetical protein
LFRRYFYHPALRRYRPGFFHFRAIDRDDGHANLDGKRRGARIYLRVRRSSEWRIP